MIPDREILPLHSPNTASRPSLPCPASRRQPPPCPLHLRSSHRLHRSPNPRPNFPAERHLAVHIAPDPLSHPTSCPLRSPLRRSSPVSAVSSAPLPISTRNSRRRNYVASSPYRDGFRRISIRSEAIPCCS